MVDGLEPYKRLRLSSSKSLPTYYWECLGIVEEWLEISYSSLRLLEKDIIKVWNAIDDEIVNTFFESLPKRIKEVHKNIGEITKY